MNRPAKRAFVALGGNRGDVASAFAAALQQLGELTGVDLVRTSANYTSAPMGTAAAEPFLNAVAELRTDWEPPRLLDHLHEFERRFGRVRNVAWGPRTLDLDLLYVGAQIVDTETLTLPHPHAWYRRFVLAPMCAIAPDFVHPLIGKTQAELLYRIDARPLIVALRDCPSIGPTALDRLRADFPEAEFQTADEPSAATVVTESTAPPSAFPLISLAAVPGQPADALRAILEAMLGRCEPDSADAHITEK